MPIETYDAVFLRQRCRKVRPEQATRACYGDVHAITLLCVFIGS